jgi:hypothetical protein
VHRRHFCSRPHPLHQVLLLLLLVFQWFLRQNHFMPCGCISRLTGGQMDVQTRGQADRYCDWPLPRQRYAMLNHTACGMYAQWPAGAVTSVITMRSVYMLRSKNTVNRRFWIDSDSNSDPIVPGSWPRRNQSPDPATDEKTATTCCDGSNGPSNTNWDKQILAWGNCRVNST